MTDPRKHLTGLPPEVQAHPKDIVRMHRHGHFNPVQLLWFAGVVVVVFEFSTYFLFDRPSGPTAPLSVESKPDDSPARVEAAISPIVESEYPGLSQEQHDHVGRSDVAVLDSFSESVLPEEKTQHAGDLDMLLLAGNRVVVTGPDHGSGDMTPREVDEPSELVTGPHADISIAEVEIPQPAPVSDPAPDPLPTPVLEADPVETAVAALATDPIVEKPTVASKESERPDSPPGLPEYEILFQTDDPLGRRVYAELLVPAFSPHTPKQDRSRVARAIAKREGLDDLTLYCTRQAREAHYSMDYSDAHPDALAGGLLGSLERGRFKPYKPR